MRITGTVKFFNGAKGLVKCVKSCKLIMGSGKAIPSEPTLARSP